ncbi:MAG TPA: hypothetical protein VHV50_07655 [Actinomycetota bacterium]|nr:hypothetical protein [Actinomycetota bacterium]
MNGRRARIVAGAIVLVLLTAACSDKGSDKPLTKAQYIAKADQICKDANEKTAALGTPSTTDPQALARFLTKSGRIITDAVAKLQRLQPPKADEQKIHRLVQGLQTSASYFPALIRAVKAQDTQKIQQLAQQLQQSSLQGSQIAQSYGFHVCAHSTGSTATPTP